MVVNMLAGNRWCYSLGVLFSHLTVILELSTLRLETSCNCGGVTMVDVAGLNTSHAVLMAFWLDFTILHWLDGCVIMVLMNLTVWHNRVSVSTDSICL